VKVQLQIWTVKSEELENHLAKAPSFAA
jgi:hypothetical protein